jgi:xanthine dehydrogenase accessory factor
MATLSAIDAIVVLGHEVEPAGRALQSAIASRAGYIASLGSPRMQQLRRDWLAYRDVAWDDRVHGPAGFDIGASSPPEIAVSIVAEALAVLRK